MSRSSNNSVSGVKPVSAVRKASGWASGLVIIALFAATLLSYAVWGLDSLIFKVTGIQIDLELYQIFASILPTTLGAATATLVARKLTGIKIKELFNRSEKHLKTVVVGFGLCIGLNLVTSLVTELFAQWLNKGGAVVTPPDFSYSNETPFWSCALLVYSCLIAPVLEEVIFRGYVLRLLRRFGTGFAILFSALLFAFYHYDLTQLLPAFVMGCLFGYIAVRSESLLPVIAVHVLNNVVAVLLSTLLPVLSPTIVLTLNIILYALALVSLIIAISVCRGEFRKRRGPALEGQLAQTKVFGAALLSPTWILLLLVYLYEIITKILVF